MRLTLITIVLMLLGSRAPAQTLADGYYLTANNDTVKTRIKIPKSIFGKIETASLQDRVKALDSISEQVVTLSPKQIQAFGFRYNNINRDFQRWTVPREKSHFFERLADGKTVECFFYGAIRGKTTIQIYVINRKNKQYSIIKLPMSRKKIKHELESLFSDQPTVVNHIESFDLPRRHFKESIIQLTDNINQD